jgi:phosphatidate cytidylyltransferase
MAPFLKRLILTAVALPLVYCLSAVITGGTHLAMAVAVTLVMAAGAAETGGLLRAAGLPTSPAILPLAAATIPAAVYLETSRIVPPGASLLWITLLAGGILAHGAMAGQTRPLQEGLPRVGGYLTQLLYPALFGSYIVRIATLDRPSEHYVLFFLTVFCNDISAYLAGRLAGGRTAVNLKVSPGKTVVGYITGSVFSMAVPALSALLLPAVFRHPWWIMALVGAATATTTFLGDLAESALKRSASVKDSGLVMLGRGGILDSVDSLVMSAPVFYLLMVVLGGG